MAWIRTILFEEADDELRALILKQRELYPREYGTPPPLEQLRESIASSHSLIPPAMYPSSPPMVKCSHLNCRSLAANTR